MRKVARELGNTPSVARASYVSPAVVEHYLAGRTLEDFSAELGNRTPMGRVGTAEEFANMALFLASDAVSYVTGTAINLDGGMSPVV